MKTQDLGGLLREYGRHLETEMTPLDIEDVAVYQAKPIPQTRSPRPIAVWSVAAVVIATVLAVAALYLASTEPENVADTPPPTPTTLAPESETVPLERLVEDGSGSAPTRGTPVPDFEGAVAGDDGAGPLPLGAVNELPGEDYLDFLFEECSWPGVEGCFRDAHFMSEDNPPLGSGEWLAGRPFHVRHGFINNSGQPLGNGFDVVVYITPMEDASESGGVPTGATVRYTSDYVLQGTSDRCGPTYKSQTDPVTCEWFVHDFPDGLPEGRHAMWAVWEAPCRAWVDLGFTDTCSDPDEVMSLFSSGVDSPISPDATG